MDEQINIFMRQFEADLEKLRVNKERIPEKDRTGKGKYAKAYSRLLRKTQNNVLGYAYRYIFSDICVPNTSLGEKYVYTWMKRVQSEYKQDLVRCVELTDIIRLHKVLDSIREDLEGTQQEEFTGIDLTGTIEPLEIELLF